jgi:hypothetical protein
MAIAMKKRGHDEFLADEVRKSGNGAAASDEESRSDVVRNSNADDDAHQDKRPRQG